MNNDQQLYVNLFSLFSIFNSTIQAHERTNEETDKLKTLKQKHDEVSKEIDEHVETAKTLTNTITATGTE